MNGFTIILNTVKETVIWKVKLKKLHIAWDRDKAKRNMKKRLRNMEERLSRSNIHIIWVLRRNDNWGHSVLNDMSECFPEDHQSSD